MCAPNYMGSSRSFGDPSRDWKKRKRLFHTCTTTTTYKGHLANNTSIEVRRRNCYYRVKIHRRRDCFVNLFFFFVIRKQKLIANELGRVRKLQTVKRRYGIVGEWRLSILKHHSQPTNHIMVRWQELFSCFCNDLSNLLNFLRAQNIQKSREMIPMRCGTQVIIPGDRN